MSNTDIETQEHNCNCKNGILPQSQECYDQMTALKVPQDLDITVNAPGQKRKEWVGVDPCLAKEIKHLWSLGIVTTSCCCGHGLDLNPMILVREDFIPKMKELGYRTQYNESRPQGKDAFIPKTKVPGYKSYGTAGELYNNWRSLLRATIELAYRKKRRETKWWQFAKRKKADQWRENELRKHNF